VLWEKEDLGGITEDNNRMPIPVVFLVILTVLTALLLHSHCGGSVQPQHSMRVMLKALDLPEVQAIQDDNAAIAKNRSVECWQGR